MDIKRFISRLTIALTVCLTVCSCHTTTKVAIHGKPGTKIYDGGRLLGTIPTSGVMKYKTDDDKYTAFFLAEEPGADIRVPFALDYKRNERKNAHTVCGISIAFFVPTIWIWPAVTLERVGQTAYNEAYEYHKDQYTNNNMLFTRPNIKYVSASSENREAKSAVISAKRQHTQVTEPSMPGNTKTATQKINRYIGGKTDGVIGSYKGSGSILQGEMEVEKLNGLSVEIENESPSKVKVRIIEANGNDFFGEPVIYEVAERSSEKVLLKHTTIKSSLISVDAKGKLELINPAIEINGSIYSLKIKADK